MPNPSPVLDSHLATWVLSPSEPQAHRPPSFLRCSAPSAPGPRPVPRFKPGGAASHSRPAASNAARRVLRAAARRGRTRGEQEPRKEKAHGPMRRYTHARRWTAPLQHAHAHASTTQPHAHARRRAGGRAGRLGGWAPRTTNRRHGAQGRSVRGGGRGPRLGSRTRGCVKAAAFARQLTPPCRSLHPPRGPRSANCPPATTNKPSRRRAGTLVTFCRTVPPRPPCP